jgi:RNA polymerase sigma-70 factor (ECF subfamily)
MAHAIEEIGLGWLASEDARDEPDIAALVTVFSRLLYRVAFSIVRHPAEAEDVVQETFLRVLENRLQLPSIRDLRPWLVRIAWNLALDRKRRIQPAQLDELLAAGLASSERPADEVLAEARRLAEVLTLMERLPRHERNVLLLAAVEELTTTEIAAVLGKSESSIRSLLFRARAHIQERLGRSNRSKAVKKGGRL